MKPSFFQKYPVAKDLLSLVFFIACVLAGTKILNAFFYRSYNVVGGSMENTLENGDRVIVNRFIVSWEHFLGNEYVPERGQIIVFANEDSEAERTYRVERAEELGVDISQVGKLTTCGAPENVTDQYIIKRVIAFPGERVVVKDGVLTVYNDENPDGFQPDDATRVDENHGPKAYTSGDIDIIVPDGEIFVSGDNRTDSQASYDSRNGLGTIPLCRIVGPVFIRHFPFDKVTLF